MIHVNQELTKRERDEEISESCILGARLFLWPESVFHIVHYWMANYNDYNLVEHEEDIFNAMIRGLLINPVRLEISANEGMTHKLSTSIKFNATLQFIGTPYHRIPLEYFASNREITLFETIHAITNPERKFFRQRVAGGLDGELQLSSFQYNSILTHFYDPSLYIMTAYLIHMIVLVNETNALVKEDWLPRHWYSLKAINEESLKDIICFTDEVKLASLKNELRVLYRILNIDDIHKAIHDCVELYHKKASDSYQSMFEKRDTLFY